MRRTFIDPKTKDYHIDEGYKYLSCDPHQGFRSKLPRSLLNKLLLIESEEIEFIKLASDSIFENALVLDAGAGQCRYKNAFTHTRYITLDRAIGDETWDYSQIDCIGDLLVLPFKTGSFHAVVCIYVLEHIPEPEIFLRELYRILSPNASLFLSVPQGFGEHQMPYDFYRYSLPGLEYLFKKVGFEIEFIRPMGGYFYFIGHWLALLPEVLTNNLQNRFLKKCLLIPLKILCNYLAPLLCFYLDRLDKGKGITVHYGCHVRKVLQKSRGEVDRDMAAQYP